MSYVVRYGKRIEIETLETVAQPARRRRVRVEETFARIPHRAGWSSMGALMGRPG
jgi:hypothetical protein